VPDKKEDLARQLRDAKAEIAEDREIKARLMKERDEAKALNNLSDRRIRSMVESLHQERIDLMGRTARIEQRMAALGFNPNPDNNK
jgi:hypothetical protein